MARVLELDPLARAAILMVAIKAIVLAFDHYPKFFMGDSGSYMYTALTGWIPGQRSFVYGFFLRLVGLWPRSFLVMIFAQTILGIMSGLALVWVLLRRLAVPPKAAITAGALFALDPFQILYERYVLTEAAAMFAFAVYAASTIDYLYRPRVWKLAVAQAFGVLLIALRMTFLSTVWVAALLLPLLAMVSRPKDGVARYVRGSVHLATSLLLATGLHAAYKLVNGELSHLPPAYIYADGLFLASALAPILEPEDAPTPEVAQIIAAPELDLRDFNLRNAQFFGPRGLIAHLQHIAGSEYETNLLAQKVAAHALRRAPLGAAKIALQSYATFYEPSVALPTLASDRNEDDPFDAQTLTSLKNDWSAPADMFVTRDGQLRQRSTLTSVYHRFAAWPWALVLLQVPLLLLVTAALNNGWERNALLLWSILSAGLLASLCVAAVIPTARFLHSFSWLLWLSCASLGRCVGSGRADNDSGFHAQAN